MGVPQSVGFPIPSLGVSGSGHKNEHSRINVPTVFRFPIQVGIPTLMAHVSAVWFSISPTNPIGVEFPTQVGILTPMAHVEAVWFPTSFRNLTRVGFPTPSAPPCRVRFLALICFNLASFSINSFSAWGVQSVIFLIGCGCTNHRKGSHPLMCMLSCRVYDVYGVLDSKAVAQR